MSKGDEIRVRRQALVGILRNRDGEPMSLGSIFKEMNQDIRLTTRTVQRDLEIMEGDGFVAWKESSGSRVKAGKKSQERVRKDGETKKKAGGWVLGSKSYEEEYEKLFSSLAIKVFCDILDASIPVDLEPELKKVLEVAKQKMEVKQKLNPHHPIVRWSGALRIEKPYTLFDAPQINGDWRLVIERAIMQRKKVRLTLRVAPWGPRAAGPAVASISHFIINQPDRPEVVVWFDDDKDDIMLNNEPACHNIALQTIEFAEILDEVASWPVDYEPHIFKTLRGQRDESWERFEFRVDPQLMGKWIGSWIERHMQVIGIDDEGWSVCRLDFPYWNRVLKERGGERDNLMEYLCSHGGDVEILAPYSFRQAVQSGLERRVASYRECQVVPEEIGEQWAKEDDEHLERVVVGFDPGPDGSWVKRSAP